MKDTSLAHLFGDYGLKERFIYDDSQLVALVPSAVLDRSGDFDHVPLCCGGGFWTQNGFYGANEKISILWTKYKASWMSPAVSKIIRSYGYSEICQRHFCDGKCFHIDNWVDIPIYD